MAAPSGYMVNPNWVPGSHLPQYIVNPKAPSAAPVSGNAPVSTIDPNSPEALLGNFSGKAYGSAPELQNILQQYSASARKSPDQGYVQGGQWSKDVQGTVDRYANTFSQMFKDKVGRDPTTDEYNTFFQQVVSPDQPWATPADFTRANAETKSNLADFFTTAAQNESQRKLQDQANNAVAPGSAFDQWRSDYAGSLNDVEKSLQDYQSKLFEKIRPQLLTSLKTQGLLDSGGLNLAFSGASKDLADTGSNYVAGLRGQAAQDIANKKYEIQSQPYNYTLGNTFGAVPSITQNGQQALQNVWNQNALNQQFAQQDKMLEAQSSNQPSLLQQYGGLMLGGAVGSFGQGIGGRLAKV